MTTEEAAGSVLFGLLLAVLLAGGAFLGAGPAVMGSIPTEPDCSMDHIINLTDCPELDR